MKLFRFGNIGDESPAVLLEDGRALNVKAFNEDYNEQFFETNGIERLAAWLEQNADDCPAVPDTFRYASCITRPSKIICIGLNYAKHAAESGMDAPSQPVVFFKATTALCGPNDDVIIPRGSEKTDWEVELAVIIGKKASYISQEEALDYVAGYSVLNDYSERAYQLEHGGQWVKGKSNDTFAPLGPYLVPSAQITDPQNLDLWLTLNGEKIQDSNTNDMIFSVAEIVAYLSNYMTLLPGDVISTGTPAGVGLGFKPPKYLKAGDVVELGIEKLGTQSQKAVAYSG